MQDFSFNLSTLDISVICIYFVVVVAAGMLLAGKSENTEEYFLAGRKMTWPLIGFSLIASQISTTSMVGLAGDAYAVGISIYSYEWMAVVLLVIFAIFIIPIILRAQIYTMPEFLEKRFCHISRTYFATITLFLNIVIDTAGSLFAGALVINLVFPDVPLWQSIAILAFFAGLYTVFGGLRAVIFTDVFQAVLLFGASIVITIFAYDKVGGWDAIMAGVPAEKMSLYRPMDDKALPWLGIFTGIPILGFYFWCTNQFMVQRILSAKDIHHARWASLLAGLLKVPMIFIMILPGSAAILLYPALDRPDLVFPVLMFDLLPAGILGLVMAGFLAALMSQIDSTLNAASTIITMDFVRPHRPKLTSKQLLVVGRVVTVIFMLLAVAWAPQIEKFPSLFRYLQNVLAYAVPPVVVLFLGGILWKRGNATGAKACIAAGIAVAIAMFVAIEIMGIMSLHFLLVAPIILAVSLVAFVAGSLASPAPSPEQYADMIWTPKLWQKETAELAAKPAWTNYRFLSVALLTLQISIVVYFW
ncbi:MAG: sodium/solute symporter [Alphaproteobacteria bacterium]|nr:sodium/solute symporter [Alphaproteobacteria bacterium]